MVIHIPAIVFGIVVAGAFLGTVLVGIGISFDLDRKIPKWWRKTRLRKRNRPSKAVRAAEAATVAIHAMSAAKRARRKKDLDRWHEEWKQLLRIPEPVVVDAVITPPPMRIDASWVVDGKLELPGYYKHYDSVRTYSEKTIYDYDGTFWNGTR